MSFSSDVKEELVKILPHDRHCRIAELSALIKYYAKITYEPEKSIALSTDNSFACRKCFTLLDKLFSIRVANFDDDIDKPKSFVILNKSNADVDKVLETVSLNDPLSLLDRDCCRRSYLRGAFIASGFVGDPQGNYHFEMVSEESEFAKLIAYLFDGFGVLVKQSIRKKHYVTYLKSVEDISDVLNVLGASRAMMEVVNARIVKDVRNSINRRNNCDTANILKAVNAASKQIEEIMLIDEKVGINSLPDSLRDIAKLRINHPESSLTELGQLLDPPVGKSGVNHRLRKISEYAAGLQ